jgi:hypothetical protein
MIDVSMKISVFLSYPTPHLKQQAQFIQKIDEHLLDRGFSPRTLGVTDYDMDAPLKAIRRLMLESNGLITIAFRRTLVEKGAVRAGADLEGYAASPISSVWWTSPYCQIEPAMAYQLGLPVLIFREKDVIAEGLLERGVIGTYMPEFDLSKPIDAYFASDEWHDIIARWEGFVRAVVEAKGTPPKLF